MGQGSSTARTMDAGPVKVDPSKTAVTSPDGVQEGSSAVQADIDAAAPRDESLNQGGETSTTIGRRLFIKSYEPLHLYPTESDLTDWILYDHTVPLHEFNGNNLSTRQASFRVWLAGNASALIFNLKTHELRITQHFGVLNGLEVRDTIQGPRLVVGEDLFKSTPHEPYIPSQPLSARQGGEILREELRMLSVQGVKQGPKKPKTSVKPRKPKKQKQKKQKQSKEPQSRKPKPKSQPAESSDRVLDAAGSTAAVEEPRRSKRLAKAADVDVDRETAAPVQSDLSKGRRKRSIQDDIAADHEPPAKRTKTRHVKQTRSKAETSAEPDTEPAGASDTEAPIPAPARPKIKLVFNRSELRVTADGDVQAPPPSASVKKVTGQARKRSKDDDGPAAEPAPKKQKKEAKPPVEGIRKSTRERKPNSRYA